MTGTGSTEVVGDFLHPPEQIIARLLIELAEATLVSDGLTWPVYVESEPQSPDNVITVFGTTGVVHARNHVNGQREEHHGVQVRVRAATALEAYVKCRAIAVAFDQRVVHTGVAIDGTDYNVQSITRNSVISIGKESPSSKRSVYVVNAVAAVCMVA